MLASYSLLNIITNFKVNPPKPESDHSPLEICIKCSYSKTCKNDIGQLDTWNSHFKYIWDKQNISN